MSICGHTGLKRRTTDSSIGRPGHINHHGGEMAYFPPVTTFLSYENDGTGVRVAYLLGCVVTFDSQQGPGIHQNGVKGLRLF